MKRWALTILIFLLLGAIANVAVAWGCALAVGSSQEIMKAIFQSSSLNPRPMTDAEEKWYHIQEQQDFRALPPQWVVGKIKRCGWMRDWMARNRIHCRVSCSGRQKISDAIA